VHIIMLFFPYLLCSVYPWSGLDFPSVVILCFSFLTLNYCLALLSLMFAFPQYRMILGLLSVR
jgi:hypothetical protein